MHASGGAWQPADHLWFIADKLLEVERGAITRLAVSVPPQHGKSQLISKYFPTWYLGRHPTQRVLQCSYGQDLTIEWTGAGRDLLAKHGPLVFGVETWERSKKTAWDIFQAGVPTGGSCRGVGKGGAVTGRPVDLGVCDDLIKGRAEADNAGLREQAWQWFESEVLPRARSLIVIATRWHHDDIIGRLIKKQEKGEGGDPWTFINIPAVAEDGGIDALNRAPGVVLWPANPLIPRGVDPVEWYRRKRAEVGPYVWQALYQGRPTALEGGMFKKQWLRYFDLIGTVIRVPGYGECNLADLRRFGTCDLSTSMSTAGDYTALAALGYHPGWGVLLLLDMLRDRIDAPDLVPSMRQMIERWDLRKLYVERAGYQLAALSMIQKAQKDGLPVAEITPEGDKIARAMPMTAAFEGGTFLLPRGAKWLPDYEEELLAFPQWPHDDQVDASAYGVIVSNKFRSLRVGGRRNSDQADGEQRWTIGRDE